VGFEVDKKKHIYFDNLTARLRSKFSAVYF